MTAVTLLKKMIELSETADKILRKDEGNLKGKNIGHRITHWSKYVVGFGTIVGVISTISSIVLKNQFMFSYGVLLTITNGIAIYYLDQLDYLAPLQKVTDDLGKKILDIQEVDRNWRKNVQETKKTTQQVGKMSKKQMKQLDREERLLLEARKVRKIMGQLTQSKKDLLRMVPEENRKQSQLFITSVEEKEKSAEEAISAIEQSRKNLEVQTINFNEQVEKLYDATNDIEDITKNLQELKKMLELWPKLKQVQQELKRHHKDCLQVAAENIKKHHQKKVSKISSS